MSNATDATTAATTGTTTATVGYAISDEDRKLYSQWTELDGDIDTCDPELGARIVKSRLGFAIGDRPRAKYWKVPEGIDCINDIDYAGDGIRGHRLDLYLPHDAVVRGGNALPIYVDIHGGGFVYGYKELNRNFCTHLAEQGFAVFSLNYRPAPQTDFLGELADVEQALAWIVAHASDYPIDAESVFITGDSAGGTLGLYAVALERSEAVAKACGIRASGVRLKGAAFISGMFDLCEFIEAASEDPESPQFKAKFNSGKPTDLVGNLAPRFLKSFSPEMIRYAHLRAMVAEVDLPPIFLNTSSDDFIQEETLALASILACYGRDFELHDRYADKGQTLGHVYPVCMSWLPESQETLKQIRDFSYARL